MKFRDSAGNDVEEFDWIAVPSAVPIDRGLVTGISRIMTPGPTNGGMRVTIMIEHTFDMPPGHIALPVHKVIPNETEIKRAAKIQGGDFKPDSVLVEK